ncbi:hypothetical protein BC941DRAFT_342661 [Chlamydoabsidia padenii]|nr:hypothetical protein BC941DRAFT_342661 [Chlamydoabsidia padenii]
MFSLKDKHKLNNNSVTKINYNKSTNSIDYTLLPKKIIKAITTYSAQQPHELSFEKGDFFHVVGRQNDRHWFAVNNPLTNVSGLVPVHCFEVVDKTPRISSKLPLLDSTSCYGTMLYDFVAERPDELSCKTNDTIMVISKVNNEWYLAETIGDLGRRGLVPISFVKLQDFTNQSPRSLYGQPFNHSQKSTNLRPNSTFIAIKRRKPKCQSSHSSPRPSVELISNVVAITVNSFIWECDRYWFVLFATVDNGRHHFYKFHLRLLHEREDSLESLPWMPEPLEIVDDIITEQRREDLDDYCKWLLAYNQHELFELKKGDVETDYAPKKGSRVVKSAPLPFSPLPTTKGDMVKIKIVHQDDIFAVKLPADCTLLELRHRVKERLGGDGGGKLKYKNDSGVVMPLNTDTDMEQAFSLAIQCGKLTVVVE